MPTPAERIDIFRKFVADNPGDAFARYSLAMSLRSEGRVREAADEFAELERRAPSYVPCYLMQGQVLELLGLPPDAARCYERGMEAAGRYHDEHAKKELTDAREALRAKEGV